MKKQLLTLALIALTSVASFAQGTISLVNTVGTPIGVDTTGDGVRDRLATAADSLQLSIWWGTSAEQVNNEVKTGLVIGSAAGVLANAPTGFLLPGTEADATYFLQARAANASGSLSGMSRIVAVKLGPTAGPGPTVWQGATGTSASRFFPLVVVPEPSTIALGVLGLGSLLLFRRRK